MGRNLRVTASLPGRQQWEGDPAGGLGKMLPHSQPQRQEQPRPGSVPHPATSVQHIPHLPSSAQPVHFRSLPCSPVPSAHLCPAPFSSVHLRPFPPTPAQPLSSWSIFVHLCSAPASLSPHVSESTGGQQRARLLEPAARLAEPRDQTRPELRDRCNPLREPGCPAEGCWVTDEGCA